MPFSSPSRGTTLTALRIVDLLDSSISVSSVARASALAEMTTPTPVSFQLYEALRRDTFDCPQC
jgi:hypothetical protein